MALMENSTHVVRPFKCSISSTLPPTPEVPSVVVPSLTLETSETIETIPTDDPNENAETSDDIANESSRIPRIMKKSPRGDPKSTRRAPSCLRYPTSPQDGSVKLSSENTSCSTASGGSEKKPKWRWWHMFTGTPKYANQKVRKNYSNVVNENCGRQHTDKIVASDLIIANVQTDQNNPFIPCKPREALDSIKCDFGDRSSVFNHEWEDEIKRTVKTAKLDVLVYHGPKNQREKNPRRLAKSDVVNDEADEEIK
ncbi:hypothetical protein QR680_015209 [Steinernema hermaphroditum]|uniref:Uncharacterized protein n=1 Tax=Steinernema hermaphroditum TaxID=289476 RepID=A0AA39IBJ2_9BILA|nr:hypothetical protein QR680_015209 [Steinernema hermaphroditum]